MDYKARLEALNTKLERDGLTEAEKVEIQNIHTRALRSLRDEAARALKELKNSL